MSAIIFHVMSGVEFIFIHGYSTGIHDFADLPERLAREFGAQTYFPVLAGHGTTLEDLSQVSREQLFQPIEEKVALSVSEGKKVVIIGLSLGAQAGLYFGSQYPLAGVVAISTTHQFGFPLNIPGISLLLRLKKFWKKNFTSADLELRKDAMVYYAMPTKGFSISKQLRRLVERNLFRIQAPVLFIHATGDTLGSPKAIPRLKQKIPALVTTRFIESPHHSMFFYPEIREEIIISIVDFCRKVLDSDSARSR